MKSLYKGLMSLCLLLIFQTAFSQAVKEKALVKGLCGMCKQRIETTAKKSGAKTAQWNAETQELEVTFVPSKTSMDAILKSVAAA